MNARYVDSRDPECDTNRAASYQPCASVVRKHQFVMGFFGAQSCGLHETNVCRTEITFCFVYCSDNILGQNKIP